MSSKMFTVDTFELHKAQGNLNLIADNIKVALCSTFSPSYSAWSTSTSYSEGDIVVPSFRNGRRYRATNAGTSASSEPTWPTVDGETVVDNDITWEEYGGEHANNEFWSSVSGEELVDGDGYIAGGASLSGETLSQISTDSAITKWDAENPSWTDLNKTMRTAWMYVDGDTPGTNDYNIAYILLNDTPADASVSGVNFKLQVSDDGIMHFGRKANL